MPELTEIERLEKSVKENCEVSDAKTTSRNYIHIMCSCNVHNS